METKTGVFNKTHQEIAEEALNILTPAINNLLAIAKRKEVHITVLDPTKMPWDSVFPETILVERAFGESPRRAEFAKASRAKAKQSWEAMASNIMLQEFGPACIKSGGTMYPGAINYYGQIVACAGVEGHFDFLISSWVAVTIQQLHRHKHEKIRNQKDFNGILP